MTNRTRDQGKHAVKFRIPKGAMHYCTTSLVAGVDPGFEIGGAPNARVSAGNFFWCH